MPHLPSIPPRHRDTIRVVVQTVIACFATWFAVQWSGLDDNMSWAMISSLLVVQASLDETMQETVFRVVATLLGTALGLACVWSMPPDLILLRIVVSAAIINALGMRWPGLRFAIVPGTMLVLAQETSLPDGALPRGMAIVLGTVTGAAVATLAVWPDRSRNRALREARAALDSSRQLLRYVLAPQGTTDAPDPDEARASFLTHMQSARDAATGAQWGTDLKTGRPIMEFVREIERLWHGIVMLERVLIEDAYNLPPDELPELREATDAVGDAVDDTLVLIARSLRRHEPEEEFADAAARLHRVRKRLERMSGSNAGGSTPTSERALGTLLFGLDEVARHLLEMIDTLSPGTAEPGRA